MAAPQLLLYALPEHAGLFDRSALVAAGYEIISIPQSQVFESWLISNLGDVLLIIAHPSATEGLNYSKKILLTQPLIPIILVTSEINQSFLKQALEIGLVDYLVTPVDTAALICAVEHAILRQKSIQVEHPYAQLLNDLVDGFILADFDSRLLLVNHSARHIFNIENDQPEGKTVGEIFYHPDLLDIFKPQRTYPYRNEITMEDGRVYSAQSSLIPEIGIAITLQEITHLKELDHIKTDFVNTVSHDLRSPLTSIYGFIGLIDRVGSINQQQAEFIRHIQSSVQHITSLINDLLDLGRVEAGYDLQMVNVNLNDVLGQAMGNLEYQYSEKMQDVVLSVPDDLPLILGNPLHLQRMITNLVENAIKFTPPLGKINIICRAEADQLILEVADNGPGIPLDDQPHIFEKFYRGSNLSQATPGTGLGLSIVKSIVEKYHGRIWLESSPLGTTFFVLLPLK
jgi:two-component system, OmpR family, phosphate regulon sensor histidine kinase PhoR